MFSAVVRHHLPMSESNAFAIISGTLARSRFLSVCFALIGLLWIVAMERSF
jgi:hypothetical protein